MGSANCLGSYYETLFNANTDALERIYKKRKQQFEARLCKECGHCVAQSIISEQYTWGLTKTRDFTDEIFVLWLYIGGLAKWTANFAELFLVHAAQQHDWDLKRKCCCLYTHSVFMHHWLRTLRAWGLYTRSHTTQVHCRQNQRNNRLFAYADTLCLKNLELRYTCMLLFLMHGVVYNRQKEKDRNRARAEALNGTKIKIPDIYNYSCESNACNCWQMACEASRLARVIPSCWVSFALMTR